MLRIIRHLHHAMTRVVDDDTDLEAIGTLGVLDAIARMKYWPVEEVDRRAEALTKAIDEEVQRL
jgi:hypothetical protein